MGALQFAAPELCGDREIVLTAIQSPGSSALQYASPELRGDRAIVREALKGDPMELCYASLELRSDRDLVLEAVRLDGWAMLYAAPALRSDKEVVSEALKRDGSLLKYVPRELRSMNKIVIAAVQQWGEALQYGSKKKRREKKVVVAAVSKNANAIKYAGKSIIKNPEVVKAMKNSESPQTIEIRSHRTRSRVSTTQRRRQQQQRRLRNKGRTAPLPARTHKDKVTGKFAKRVAKRARSSTTVKTSTNAKDKVIGKFAKRVAKRTRSSTTVKTSTNAVETSTAVAKRGPGRPRKESSTPLRISVISQAVAKKEPQNKNLTPVKTPKLVAKRGPGRPKKTVASVQQKLRNRAGRPGAKTRILKKPAMDKDKAQDNSPRLRVNQKNPKKEGTNAYTRYEQYKSAKSVAEFYSLGGQYRDLHFDKTNGYVKML